MKRVFLQTSGRSGSHHILSNLHYQDDFFCLSEHERLGVKKKNKVRKDCFHRNVGIGKDKKFLVYNKQCLKHDSSYENFYSINSLSYVWSNNEKIPIEEIIKDENVYTIFLFRHPILVCESFMRLSTRGESFINRNLEGITNFYKEGYEEFKELKEKNFKVIDVFYENFVKNKRKEMRRLFKFFGTKGKIKTFKDFSKVKLKGPGNYNPKRVVKLHKQLEIIEKIKQKHKIKENEFLNFYDEFIYNLKNSS